MRTLPSGTVTFLFTDIEGSTRLAQQYPDSISDLLERHLTILKATIEAHDGYIFQVVGDAICAGFQTVKQALDTAVEAQRYMLVEAWEAEPIRIRMGIATGTAQIKLREGRPPDYSGYLSLARAQRIMSAAHGGQILLADASAGLVRGELPQGASLRDMGEHRLKNIISPEHLWQVVAPGLQAEFPSLLSLNAIPNNLPLQLTTFIGRERELAQVRELLEKHRLVTLTGAGGTGKTRLALQVAAEVLDQFNDGVWFVELAPISDPALIPQTVVRCLRLFTQSGREPLDVLSDYLSDKALLLILDNCEHLLGACCHVALAILQAAPSIKIMPTSREVLNLAGEQAYRVPSLAAPDINHLPQVEQLTQFEAVRLFTDRATLVSPGFTLTKSAVPAVAQICHRLDGIPLAIELAAARAKVLSADEIATRLNDRFRLLTGGGRTAIPRHQTLRSLIDWSYSLLGEQERVLLRRISTFAGGWTLEAAEEVCSGDGLESAEVLDLLTHLIDKSLVGVEEATKESRYRMLETIREYAREKLKDSGEIEAVRRRHLAFMLTFAVAATSHGHGLDEGLWHDRLDREVDNLRAALECAMSLEDAQAALRLAGSLYWFWWTRGYWNEGHKWLQAALDKAGADRPTGARAHALKAMGWFLYMADELDVARALAAESVAISRTLGDKLSLAQSLTVLGLVGSLSDPATVSPMLHEGLALSRELDYKQGIAAAQLGLGNCSVSKLDDENARADYEDSARLFRELGDKNQLAFAVRQLGFMALRQVDYPKAFALCAESLSLNMETRDPRGVAASLAAIGSIAAQQRRARPAARLYGAATAILESLGAQLIPLDQNENEPYELAARAEIGNQGYDSAFSEGHAMKMEPAAAYALEQARG